MTDDTVKAAHPRKSRRRRGTKPVIEPFKSLTGQRIVGTGGNLNPLDERGIAAIHAAALELLASTGISEAPSSAVKLVADAGGRLDDAGRLLFPEKLVEAALTGLQRDFTLYGRAADKDLVLTPGAVHVGTGGASPQLFDMQLGRYRDSCLADLYDAARLVDMLTHIHFFSRPLVARDMPDQQRLDVNTAYASLAGTTKHVFVSSGNAQSVADIARLCYRLAGSEAAFRERPFLSLLVNHAVPPMRFDTESVEILQAAVRHGIPMSINTFGQLGASSPVTIAGCVAQTTAETLAGMVLVHLAAPGGTAIFGPRPMITDLRTGAMSGGGGEQAKLTAAAMSMARFYGLPNSTIAGATDSKVPDAQSGYEKCLTVTLALQAGADIITQAAGAQASLMGASLEAYVIDNDMLGSILSAHTAIDVSAETLNLTAMQAAITGAGHFLGEADTLARMNSDFLYPQIGDRRSIEEWQDAGALTVWDRAHEQVRAILDAPPVAVIASDTSDKVARQFGLPLLGAC